MIRYNISFSYPKCRLFENLQFEYESGQVISLCGHNGAGKTTLLKILAGILPLEDGKFIKPPVKSWLLPSNGGLIGGLSLAAHLELTKTVCGGRLPGITEQAIQLLETKRFMNTPVDSLSSGQYAKAAIIIMLANSPQLLLLDEPFAFLDPKASNRVCTLLKSLEEVTIIFSSHDLHRVESFADRCQIIKEGAILWDSASNGNNVDLDILQVAYDENS